jgi:hypothetical protein
MSRKVDWVRGQQNDHVWMEVLVLVCSKLTPKLILWSQTHVLVWC